MKKLELSEQAKSQLNKLIGKFAKQLREEYDICELDLLSISIRISNEEGDSAELFASRHHQHKESVAV